MQTPPLHQPEERAPATSTRRRSRRLVLIAAGALALGLATIGSVAALGGGTSPARHTAAGPTSVTVSNPPRATTTSKAPGKPASVAATPLLADGTYPAYIDRVDTDGAAITVDVIQVFQGKAATTAAVQDGMSASDARYLGVYVRNENPRLRTLPVAGDARIQLLHECESPPSPPPSLNDLRSKTTPFNDLYYYEITVKDGVIRQITEHLARPAC
jgi:hypothetical protein